MLKSAPNLRPDLVCASQVVGGVKDDASGTTERRGDGSRRSSLPSVELAAEKVVL
jgi:hypothetical protein